LASPVGGTPPEGEGHIIQVKVPHPERLLRGWFLATRYSRTKRPPSLIAPPRHRPVPLPRMVPNIPVLRFKPAAIQQGIDVVVPERILATVEKVCQIFEHQVSSLTEEENCRHYNFFRCFPQGSYRFSDLLQCIQMFGVPGQMFGARLQTSCPNSEHVIFHRMMPRPVVKGIFARTLAHQELFLDQATKGQSDIMGVLFCQFLSGIGSARGTGFCGS
jgi:hypothetical protein